MLIGLGVGGAVLLVLVIAAVVALVLGKSQLPAPVAIVKVDLGKVLDDWRENPVELRRRLHGQIVELSGVVVEARLGSASSRTVLTIRPDKELTLQTIDLIVPDAVYPLLEQYPKGSKITLRAKLIYEGSTLEGEIVELVR